jgi:hypothetical protein
VKEVELRNIGSAAGFKGYNEIQEENLMLRYIGFATLLLFIVLMIGRGVIMKRGGIKLLVVAEMGLTCRK